MQRKNTLIVLFSAALMACGGNGSKEKPVNNAKAANENVTVKEPLKKPMEDPINEGMPAMPEATTNFEYMELNDGEKWKANPETTAGIRKMQSRLEKMPETMEGYQELVMLLHQDFEKILEQCTMTGKSHEQLHLYLEPLMERIDRIDAPDIRVMQSGSKELKDYLTHYDDYFK